MKWSLEYYLGRECHECEIGPFKASIEYVNGGKNFYYSWCILVDNTMITMIKNVASLQEAKEAVKEWVSKTAYAMQCDIGDTDSGDS